MRTEQTLCVIVSAFIEKMQGERVGILIRLLICLITHMLLLKMRRGFAAEHMGLCVVVPNNAYGASCAKNPQFALYALYTFYHIMP